MSGTGDLYRNAVMESPIGTIKTEGADYCFHSRQVDHTELFAYLEGWRNRQRLRSVTSVLPSEKTLFSGQVFVSASPVQRVPLEVAPVNRVFPTYLR